MHRKNGFTLIELLVVIAIIAILAAILLPVFARARENARKSTCQNNMKQMASALMQYTQDYDERLPGRYTGGEAGSWRVVIQPYVKSANVFICPSNSASSQLCLDGVFHRSYACNGNSSNIGGTAPMQANAGVNIAQIQTPSQLILLAEYTEAHSEVAMGWGAGSVPLWAGHSGMANWAFADGHVKSLKATATAIPLNLWICEGATAQGPQSLIDRLTPIDQKYQ